MTIRNATTDDLPAILAIYNHAVLNGTATADYEPHTLEMRAAWMADRNERGFPILVAEEDDFSVLGWASLSPYHARIGYRFSCENSLYVDAKHWGKGIGRALLAELLERANQMDIHAIIAAIDGDNAASIHLHSAFGFEHCGRFPQVVQKFDRWLDVVYMVKLFAYAS